MRGHIRRRGKDSWQVIVEAGTDANGKRRQQYRTVHGRKKDAEAVLARMLHERGATSSYRTDPTVGEILTDYLAGARLAATTAAEAERSRKKIPDAFLRQPAWRVRGPQLTALYVDLERAGVSVHRVRKVHVLLSAAFGQAVKWGDLTANPAMAASPPPAPRSTVRAPEASDVARLLNAAGPELRVALLLAATTGMRRGEVCGLQWDDLDLLAGTYTVRRSVAYTKASGVVVKVPKSGRTRPPMALGGAVCEALRDWYADRSEITEPTGFVLNRDGKGEVPWRPDLLTHRFVRLRDDLGLRLRLHDLRHFMPTQALAAGVSPRIVAERGGWARVSVMLETYADAVPAADRQAAQLLDDALGLHPYNRDKVSDS